MDQPFDARVFCATLSIWTPLHALRREGEIIPLEAELPSDIPPEHGHWRLRAKGFADLGLPGIDDALRTASREATPFGPVHRPTYVAFLTAMRSVVEDATIDGAAKEFRLSALCAKPEYDGLAELHGGPKMLIDLILWGVVP